MSEHQTDNGNIQFPALDHSENKLLLIFINQANWFLKDFIILDFLGQKKVLDQVPKLSAWRIY